MKKSDKLLVIGSLLLILSIGSAIIIGLTYVPWNYFLTNPRESILIIDIPLFTAGIILINIGWDLDEKGK